MFESFLNLSEHQNLLISFMIIGVLIIFGIVIYFSWKSFSNTSTSTNTPTI